MAHPHAVHLPLGALWSPCAPRVWLQVIYLVKDRLVDKVNHQQMVMGLGPALRWVSEGIFWSCIMWLIMCPLMSMS